MCISFDQLPPYSRVWVYQADRPFSLKEENEISDTLLEFCSQWSAHGNALQTSFRVEFNRFIILAVDESAAGASGCSIDGSVRTLKQLGDRLGIDFFDRTKIAFLNGAEIQAYPLTRLSSLFTSNVLTASSITFDNLVATKEEWEQRWKTTAAKSWLVKYLPKHALSI